MARVSLGMISAPFVQVKTASSLIQEGFGSDVKRRTQTNSMSYTDVLLLMHSPEHPSMPLPKTLNSSVKPLGKATQFAEDIHEIINQAPFFDELSFSELQNLCEFMDCYTIRRDGLLIREGDAGDFLLIILTGTVNVVKDREDGGRRVIATAGPGATLGEMAIVDNGVRFASCIANEEVDFAVLDRGALNAILHEHPRLGNKVLLMLLALMTKRLRDTGLRLIPHLGAVIV
jgi:hypothetical protein